MKYGKGQYVHEPDGDAAVGAPPDVASREWLVSFLLLCTADGGLCGHELERKIRDIGFHGKRPGEVYQALRRMEKDGLISSAPAEPGALSGKPGLPWRRYEIAEPGEAYLELRADLLVDDRRITDFFLETYERQCFGRDLA